MGIVRDREKFMQGFTITFLHKCFGCSNSFTDSSKAAHWNRKKIYQHFVSPSRYSSYYVDSSKPSIVCKSVDSTKRKKHRNSMQSDSSNFSADKDINGKISPDINIQKRKSARKVRIYSEDGGLPFSETDHEENNIVLEKKIKKRSHFKKRSPCKISVSNNGKLVKKCKQVESIFKSYPPKSKRAVRVPKPHSPKNKQVERICKPYPEKSKQVESLHKPHLKKCKQAKNVCKPNIKKGKQTENISKPYLEKDKQTETGCKQNLSSKCESSDIVISSKSGVNLKRKKKDSLLKGTKEPCRGTLKRRRWNQAKYNENNENHEDDLFEARKFDLAELSELAEDSYTDSIAMILTPDVPEIYLTADEVPSTPYKECCTAEEYNILRTKAQEYHFRRNKRKVKSLD
ncbi:uncharacterized protein LOC118198867, partial [Stegodyphus dumicola]|uniref:uncharacterized protein LOC118198867 n=1 Tax=Stegodyphus dumicola TaxID=202533 RepID=UPI0015B2ACA9